VAGYCKHNLKKTFQFHKRCRISCNEHTLVSPNKFCSMELFSFYSWHNFNGSLSNFLKCPIQALRIKMKQTLFKAATRKTVHTKHSSGNSSMLSIISSQTQTYITDASYLSIKKPKQSLPVYTDFWTGRLVSSDTFLIGSASFRKFMVNHLMDITIFYLWTQVRKSANQGN